MFKKLRKGYKGQLSLSMMAIKGKLTLFVSYTYKLCWDFLHLSRVNCLRLRHVAYRDEPHFTTISEIWLPCNYSHLTNKTMCTHSKGDTNSKVSLYVSLPL